MQMMSELTEPIETPSVDETALSAPKVESLGSIIDSGEAEACSSWLEVATNRDAVHALSRLSDDQRVKLLGLITTEEAADVIDQLPEQQAVDALEEIHPTLAAGILEELPSDEQTDYINALDDDKAHAIINQLTAESASAVRRLSSYDEEVAGGLMVTEYLAYPVTNTVRDVLDDLDKNSERYEHFNIQYSYVVDETGLLLGVLPMRRLLLAKRNTELGDVMIKSPARVEDMMHLDDLATEFREHPYIGLPVTNTQGILLGVIERSGVEQALAQSADSVYRHSQGIVGGEELRSMPLTLRSRRRLGWLSINIVLNMLAASIIAMHQDTLEAVIALAVFLPIISDMSGCSGNQAVAVSMRELTLGVTRPQDIGRVLFKECSVGIINGIALGLLIGLVAYLWKGNLYLGSVVAIALMLNTIVAVCIGGTVPLILKKFKADPALASGPILTTITDMCGFLLVLTLASSVIDQLNM